MTAPGRKPPSAEGEARAAIDRARTVSYDEGDWAADDEAAGSDRTEPAVRTLAARSGDHTEPAARTLAARSGDHTEPAVRTLAARASGLAEPPRARTAGLFGGTTDPTADPFSKTDPLGASFDGTTDPFGAPFDGNTDPDGVALDSRIDPPAPPPVGKLPPVAGRPPPLDGKTAPFARKITPVAIPAIPAPPLARKVTPVAVPAIPAVRATPTVPAVPAVPLPRKTALLGATIPPLGRTASPPIGRKVTPPAISTPTPGRKTAPMPAPQESRTASPAEPAPAVPAASESYAIPSEPTGDVVLEEPTGHDVAPMALVEHHATPAKSTTAPTRPASYYAAPVVPDDQFSTTGPTDHYEVPSVPAELTSHHASGPISHRAPAEPIAHHASGPIGHRAPAEPASPVPPTLTTLTGHAAPPRVTSPASGPRSLAAPVDPTSHHASGPIAHHAAPVEPIGHHASRPVGHHAAPVEAATPAARLGFDAAGPAAVLDDGSATQAELPAFVVEPVEPVHRRRRVVVANRRDGGLLFWIARLYGFALLVLVATLMVACFFIYSYFSLAAPPVPDLERYAKISSGVSRIYAADGTVIGQYAKEWRQIVPYEKIPQRLIDAFLAVEDHEFFDHRGLYFKGIARAVWRNITSGDFAQGGSTITQQVAKQFLGSEKSLSRKGKEAVMARRLEAQYSKRAILAVYLNHIYLGAGAWGVAAAAERYFQKDLDHLTLAEAAMIAGLAKAPTKFSPQNQPKLALDRRNVVLDKMATYGFASAADVTAAKAEPIKLGNYRDTYADRLPYYGTYVRNYVTKNYGDDALFSNGLRIETAAEPAWEASAYENADFGAHHQDKRQGWRGPEWRVDGPARDLFISRQKQLYGPGPLVPGKRYLAVVDKVQGESAEVLVGDRRLQLPLKNMRWAAKWQRGNADNDLTIDSAAAALKAGYVVWVKREQRTIGRYRDWVVDAKNPAWIPSDDQHEWDAAHPDVVRLDQVPHPQTAIFTADHRTGYVAALVGGYDYDRSVFNRAVQACRQPGSTYKPIYYSLGLDQGFGFDTRLTDVPITIIDPITGEKWTPTNLDDTMDNDVTLEFALVFSKNVPSVDLFRRLGAKNVETWARRLGFSTKIFADDALALGASCSKLDEMARAFTVFARNGTWWPRPEGKQKNWIYVRRIADRDGNLLEDNTTAGDPQLAAADRLDRSAALAGVVAPQAIPARAAFLTSRLLANEVTYGFANVLRATQLNAAGKTGTSSDTHDTLFIGYTSQFTTLVWMGDDRKERALGRSDAAYMTVVPLWSRYMYEAAKSYPNPTIPWSVPPGVKANDRGDHTKGEKVPQMDLIWKLPKKPEPEATEDRPPV